MEHFGGLAKVKEFAERARARMSNMRKESERVISRTLQVVETTATLGGWGYANGRWGEVSAQDASSLAEIKLLGMPADLVAGGVLLGVSFFKGLGAYEEHGFNVGTGSTGAFAYRMGYEMGSKSAHESHAGKTTTKGTPAMTAGNRGAHGGRVHTVYDGAAV